MKLLLDTHALIWWLIDSRQLSNAARDAIANPDNDLWVSAVTGWECATKYRIGKLPEAHRFVLHSESILRDEAMKQLPVALRHGIRAGGYGVPHADPFDRMLAAQSEMEGLVLVTCDPAFRHFPVQTFW